MICANVRASIQKLNKMHTLHTSLSQWILFPAKLCKTIKQCEILEKFFWLLFTQPNLKTDISLNMIRTSQRSHLSFASDIE